MSFLLGLLSSDPPDIGKLKARHKTSRLVNALRHKNASVRRDAARALGELLETRKGAPAALVGLLQDDHQEVREEAVEALRVLAAHDKAVAGRLLRCLSDSNSRGAHEHLRRALVGAGASVAEVLVDAIGSKDTGPVAQELVLSLGADVVEALETKLDSLVAGEAATLLLKIGGERPFAIVVSALEEKLKSRKDQKQRQTEIAHRLSASQRKLLGQAEIISSQKVFRLLYALAETADPRSIEPLLAALTAPIIWDEDELSTLR